MPTSPPKIVIPYKYLPRDYQLPFWQAAKTYRFLALVWARRHGKDLTCWNYAIDQASRQPMDVTYIYPTSEMGKNNLWEAKTNDGMLFTDYIPMALRQRRNTADDGLNDTDKSVTLLNGSIIRLASGDRPGRLRGGNSKLYVLSEFPEMDPEVLDIIEPIIEANGGQIIVNFTPKGDNHAKGSWEAWKEDDAWFTQLISADQTTVFTPDQLERIKRRIIERFRLQGRSEVEAISYFMQEYFCSFDTPVIGSYFGEALRIAEEQKRIGIVQAETDLTVDTYWDLGMDDSMSIWFVQRHNREVRLIDYYENSGEGLAHYAQTLQQKGYVYGEHWAPHDIRVREMGTGVSRLETAKKLGINFQIAPSMGLEDGINAARMLLARCWFDAERTKRGVQALRNYHKDWDERLKVFRSKPKHDWSSHGADSFRTLATSIRDKLKDNYLPTDDIPRDAQTFGIGVATTGIIQPSSNNPLGRPVDPMYQSFPDDTAYNDPYNRRMR